MLKTAKTADTRMRLQFAREMEWLDCKNVASAVEYKF